MRAKTVFLLPLLAACVARADVCVKDGEAIGFLGDSITAYGHKKPAGYANLVIEGLSLSGVKAGLLPAGHGGDKADGLLARVDRQVLAKGARWTTVCCGVNDIWHIKPGTPFEEVFAGFRASMTAILDKCAASNVTAIVLTTPMTERTKYGFNGRIDAFNEWLKGEAARRGLRVADVNAAAHAEVASFGVDVKKDVALTEDGVHMAFPGDCVIAWTVLQTMGVPASEKDRMFEAFRKRKADAEAAEAARRATIARKKAAEAAAKEGRNQP